MRRDIPAVIYNRVRQMMQSAAQNADPFLQAYISRHVIPITDYRLWQTAEIPGTTPTQTCIAIRRLDINTGPDGIYVAALQNNRIYIYYADFDGVTLPQHYMLQDSIGPASAVSIAFDGTMPKTVAGRVEFITEAEPWVFWVNGGVVYGRHGDTQVTLAEANATAISAVRAMWSQVGGFDFGLCLFMVLNGSIYYRQLIDGVWADAAPINFGPDKTWVDIAASRTWDYRVVLQALASDGTLWELFSQYQGIGKQNTEHIEISSAKAKGQITAIKYHDTREHEHIELASVTALGKNLWAWPSIPVSARNLPNGNNDWGHIVEVTLDHPVTNVADNGTAFKLTDSRGVVFTGVAAMGEANRVLTLTLNDFNSAFGDVTLSYTPGGVNSPAVPMEAWQITFAPQNLVPPQIDPPEPEELGNE